ncbi:hypothetical protein [Alcaligenes sp. Marseille-Q7550]
MSRPVRRPAARTPIRSSSSSVRSRRSPFSGQLSTRAKLLDVCLVAVWGATIPGLLWLGSMGGF